MVDVWYLYWLGCMVIEVDNVLFMMLMMNI